jgi:hypothetical protein
MSVPVAAQRRTRLLIARLYPVRPCPGARPGSGSGTCPYRQRVSRSPSSIDSIGTFEWKWTYALTLRIEPSGLALAQRGPRRRFLIH